ncbi:hypothetical protein [Asticcacaulis sp. EMRT-3]|uniref:hypothetical protein n=1 Tax=Asticcacaulis sp. EMRT-3 TaxID=3040349 RepID=UPI0024AF26D9|nr:hypothetical protein [Asticcacaulis sp. EMRT-3]MDI7774222.1 hypothetical protein [Asticcacaulis sp. EMRT-3]
MGIGHGDKPQTRFDGTGPTDYGMGNGRVLMRIPEPLPETVTLRRPIAAEFGVTAVSSPTRWLDAWLPDLHLAELLTERNAEVVAADDAYNGFLRLTLTPDMALGEWMSVDTLMSRQFICFSQDRFEVRAQNGVAERVA